jgi:DNA-binding response OmpR family regulator
MFGHGRHALSVVASQTVKENTMRVMIAGTDRNTLISLRAYFSDRGHESEISRNGVECMVGLREFVPDLLIMEFDILWGGCEGVLATMNADPRLTEVPVVLFTETYKQLALDTYPKIIARLTHPFQPHELRRLNELIDNMDAARAVDTSSAKRNGLTTDNYVTSIPYESDRGGIRQDALRLPSMLLSDR